MIVIDASVATEWYLRDRDSGVARASLIEVSSRGAVAPGNFWVETLEALLRGIRRSKIISEEVAGAVAHLSGLDIVAIFPPLTAIAAFAQKYSLRAYDAGYLAVAKQRGVPVATLDMKLAEAAEAEGVLWTPPPPDEVEKKFSLLLAG